MFEIAKIFLQSTTCACGQLESEAYRLAAIQNDGLVLVIIFMIKVTVLLTQMIVSFRFLEMDSM